jgi:hypothetical protein
MPKTLRACLSERPFPFGGLSFWPQTFQLPARRSSTRVPNFSKNSYVTIVSATGDERTNREWSFGYYLNSARFRLFHAKKIQSGNPDGWAKEYDFLKETRSADKDINWEWQRHVGVFEEELAEFQTRLGA